ncbi:MAG: hypothetical protein ACW99U_17100 [Candidatus Thorarchaeota archaeon]
MIHFQTKNHLLMWLEANCPRKAIVRALRDGTVEHLGGFSRIPPTSHPGWITRVTSIHDKEFIVAVIAYQNRYGIRVLGEIPWKYWCNVNAWGKPGLMAGDDPYTYHTKMVEAL